MTIKQKSSLGWITANQYISESSLLPTFIRTTDRQSFRVQQLATELSFRPGVRMSWNLLYICTCKSRRGIGWLLRVFGMSVFESWTFLNYSCFRWLSFEIRVSQNCVRNIWLWRMPWSKEKDCQLSFHFCAKCSVWTELDFSNFWLLGVNF